ncbi:MAG: UPF0280 family protein [Desulfovibrionaceae bacterium]|jgi:ApbE superfamily uncharacterized protein (UPF0280 family)|nr:UPF0280 family protein [Desulfovibrionaceae bacterium]
MSRTDRKPARSGARKSGAPKPAVHTASARTYRAQCRPRSGEVRFQVVLEQTDLLITAHADLSDAAARIAREQRGLLKAYIQLCPEFATSLVPLDAPDDAPEIVRDMCAAGRACDVGPMAAVAGAIAERVARGLLGDGPGRTPEALVENGGDVFLCSLRERVVGLLADPAGGARLGVRLGPEDFPVALCSSSATIGHSLSLGAGELVAVRARSGAFADAAATALCNLLRHGEDVQRVLETAQELAPLGLDGVLAQCGPNLGAWGAMELTAL